MAHIFISYSSKQKDYAKKLLLSLREKQIDAWMDEHIAPGKAWFRSVVEAIRKSAGIIVVMTPEAEQSQWVHKEILIGLDDGKPFFPLLLQGKVMPILIDIQAEDVRGGRMPSERFYSLLSELVLTPVPASNPQSPAYPHPFALRNNRVAFTRSFTGTHDCDWQGFGGVVLDTNRQPLDDIYVHVFGGQGVSLYTVSGTHPAYGFGGWEIQVSQSVKAQTYYVELLSSLGTVLSPTVQVIFPGQCKENLAIVNFEQVSP